MQYIIHSLIILLEYILITIYLSLSSLSYTFLIKQPIFLIPIYKHLDHISEFIIKRKINKKNRFEF